MTVRQGRLNGSTSKSTSNVSLYLLRMCIGWLVEVGWWRCGARGIGGPLARQAREVATVSCCPLRKTGGGCHFPDPLARRTCESLCAVCELCPFPTTRSWRQSSRALWLKAPFLEQDEAFKPRGWPTQVQSSRTGCRLPDLSACMHARTHAL